MQGQASMRPSEPMTDPSTGSARQSSDRCFHAGASEHAPSDATVESVVGCSASQVAEMQESVRSALEGDTGAISAARVLHLYLERLSIDFQACPRSHVVLSPSQQPQLSQSRPQQKPGAQQLQSRPQQTPGAQQLLSAFCKGLILISCFKEYAMPPVQTDHHRAKCRLLMHKSAVPCHVEMFILQPDTCENLQRNCRYTVLHYRNILNGLSIRCALQDVQAAGRIAGDALQIMAETAFEPSLMDFPPSLVAAATLYVARKKVGSSPFWPNALAQLTGTAPPKHSQQADSSKRLVT